jgi:hypothetical protein
MKSLPLVSLVFALAGLGACIPQAQVVPAAVKTSIEKTTVTVKDPQGNVLRIEEKEMVLQEYTAKDPVGLKTVAPPPLQRLHYENGKLVEER